MEKILIDASNIKVGGGLQVSISVINSLINEFDTSKFVFAVSTFVFEQLDIPKEHNGKFYIIDMNLSKPFEFYRERNKLICLLDDYNIKTVFTIFGPSFWNPKNTKHLIGFANAWIVSPNSQAYIRYPLLPRLKLKLKNYLIGKALYSKKAHYVTETESVKKLFCDYFSSNEKSISVVGNCISQIFTSSHEEDIYGLGNIDKFKFMTVSFNYPHKNLSVISSVGKYLESKGFSFVFVVTIDEGDYNKLSDEFKKYTYNLGKVNLSDCKSVYKYSDALFLPTLIECFTVSYLEAFYTRKPILTSDLDFANEICGEAAFYFDPYNLNSINLCCENVINDFHSNKNLINRKIDLYDERLGCFGGNTERVSSYLKIIERLNK
ncbi:glycosyltransferase [Photobacterium damselae]